MEAPALGVVCRQGFRILHGVDAQLNNTASLRDSVEMLGVERRPPPPELLRSSHGLASYTVSARPTWPLLSRAAIAAWASASEPISTNPKPLLRPVARLVTTSALTMFPWH